MMRMPFASTVSFKNSFTLSVTSEIIKRLLNVYSFARGVLNETPLLHLITFSIVCVPNQSLLGVNNSDIILISARGKLPTWGSWDILKATRLQWSQCLKERTHVSTRGTIHDQRDVSQGCLDQRDCSSDGTRSQNHSASRHRA